MDVVSFPRLRDRRIPETRTHRDECRDPAPLGDRDYGDYLRDLVRRFGAVAVGRFNRTPSGWAYADWKARRAAQDAQESA